MNSTTNSVSNSAKIITPKETVKLVPEFLSFGIVAQGFVYDLPVTLINKSLQPQTFRIACMPIESYERIPDKSTLTSLAITRSIQDHVKTDNELNSIKVIFISSKVAPGMSTTFTLQLSAEMAVRTHFVLAIAQSYEKEIITVDVTAMIVALDVFKHLRRALQLNDKAVYRNGVQLVNALPSLHASLGDDKSAQTGGPTVYSEALLDDEDVDELSDMPIVGNVYWDPVNKCLEVDKDYGKVFVDSNWSVNDSINTTMKHRSTRSQELEEKGFYTSRVANRMREHRQSPTLHTLGEHTGDADMDYDGPEADDLMDSLSHESFHTQRQGNLALPLIDGSNKR